MPDILIIIRLLKYTWYHYIFNRICFIATYWYHIQLNKRIPKEMKGNSYCQAQPLTQVMAEYPSSIYHKTPKTAVLSGNDTRCFFLGQRRQVDWEIPYSAQINPLFLLKVNWLVVNYCHSPSQDNKIKETFHTILRERNKD